MKLITSREFNRDVSQAKRAAQTDTVLITDRGQPTHVLMSMAEFHRLTGQQESIVDLLAMPEATGADVPGEGDWADLADGAWDQRPPLD